MKEDDKDIEEIFHRYLSNKCTREEVDFLFRHFNIPAQESLLKELIRNELDEDLTHINIEEEKAHLEKLYRNISNEVSEREEEFSKVKMNLIPFLRIAASILLVSIIGIGLYMHLTETPLIETAGTVIKGEPQPGSDKAILTLYNGSQIILNDLEDGEILNLSGMTLSKSSAGQVVYEIDPSTAINFKLDPPLNTITTPRGGQFEIVLPDGTRVWLNSASSLTFPIAFLGNDRKVRLSGEGYFEVAHNQSKPFIVSTEENEIEVLGTSFNIMEYPNEGISQTTLIEGSVRFRKGPTEKILKPGQQAETVDGQSAVTINPVNINKVIAWKNGIFLFDRTELKQVMQQIGRWYDAEVVYEGKQPSALLTGMVSRKGSLRSLLDILELAEGVKFEIEGNKIIVQNLK